MSKFKTILTYTAGMALVAVIALSANSTRTGFTDGKVSKLEAEIASMKAQEDQDRQLGQYVINMMYQTSAATKLSDAKKLILARSIVKVANDVFETYENKKAFVALLAIESEFQRTAQSPTGPKGLSQVAKGAFKEGLASCGITNYKDDDVWETDINLYAGACYFRTLLETHNGDHYIAIVGYNQGPYSKDVKSYAKHGRVENIEALKYIARFTFLKRTVTDKKKHDVVAMEKVDTKSK